MSFEDVYLRLSYSHLASYVSYSLALEAMVK